MKKKALLYGLCVALLLSLTACGKAQEEQPPAEPEPPEVETTAPEPLAEPQPEPQKTAALEPVSDTITAAPGVNDDPQEQAETAMPEKAEPETVAPFTEVNETVYATGSVNIRASWSANSEKLGALSWGESVTRTGIGTGEAENWSMVKLADGSVAYISSNYLSLTKPAAQQAASTNSGSGTATGSSGSSTSTAPASGSTQAAPSSPSSSESTIASPPNGGKRLTREELSEGIDFSSDPWDTQAKVIYGGSG